MRYKNTFKLNQKNKDQYFFRLLFILLIILNTPTLETMVCVFIAIEKRIEEK